MLQELKDFCKVEKDLGAYRLSFLFDRKAHTTIRVIFNDPTGADMVITAMTTLPATECRHGYGKKALNILLHLARKNGLKDIRAVHVQKPSEGFWVNTGFTALGNATNDFLYRKE